MVSEVPQKNKANKIIGKVCSKSWSNLSEPLTSIAEALQANGFDAEPMNAMYCGDKGQMHVQVGKKTWLVVQWYLLNPYPASSPKRWEINSYLS